MKSNQAAIHQLVIPALEIKLYIVEFVRPVNPEHCDFFVFWPLLQSTADDNLTYGAPPQDTDKQLPVGNWDTVKFMVAKQINTKDK